MAVNWPSNPTDGQEHVEAGQTWVYRAPPNVWAIKLELGGNTGGNVDGGEAHTNYGGLPLIDGGDASGAANTTP